MCAVRRPSGRYAGRSAQERSADRRARLLEAGLDLFGGRPGYRASTVTAVSQAAGLSTRQFYEEFRGLEDLLATLYGLVNDEAERAVLETLGGTGHGSFPDRAAAGFLAYARSIARDPRRVRITFVEVVGASPEMERIRMARRARWRDLMHAEVVAAVGRGEVAERDYRVAATAFIGAVDGLLHDWNAGQVEATLEEIVAELVLMLTGALRP